jgi:hypothetical protein
MHAQCATSAPGIVQPVPVRSSRKPAVAHVVAWPDAGANRKGHECIVLGDFNTRVGTSDADVVPHLEAAAVPPHLQHDAQHFINIYGSIKVLRRNSDENDPDKQAARHFMHGLSSVQCVSAE